MNNGLARLTRHQLVQADRLEQLKQGRRSAENGRKKVERDLQAVEQERRRVEQELSAELAAASVRIRALEDKLKPKPKPKPKLPPDYLPVTKAIWETV